MKKIISLVLAILMLAGIVTLASCKDKEQPDDTGTVATTAAVSADTEPEYTFPEAYYNDESFVVYNRIASDYGAE